MHGNNGSGKGSTDPDARWGRDVQEVQNKDSSLHRVPTVSNHERVTRWLGSEHGVGGGGGSVHHQGGGNGGAGEKWNGTANWTGQQGEERGNGSWDYDNKQNAGSGGSARGGGGGGWGGQASGTWQGEGGNAAGGGGGNTAVVEEEEDKW